MDMSKSILSYKLCFMIPRSFLSLQERARTHARTHAHAVISDVDVRDI